MTRFVLRFGAPVRHDGETLGRLDGIILDGSRRRWEAIIVRRGLLRRSYRLAPRSMIRLATDEQIVLDAPPEIQTDARASRGAGPGMAVRTSEGRGLGRLVMLLSGADGNLADLVVERRSYGPRRMIPAALITAVEAHGLVVDLDRAVDDLPLYRADRDLAVLARWEIERLGLRGSEGLFVKVSATGGVVTLDGHVTSPLSIDRIAAAIAAVPGVHGVVNRLEARSLEPVAASDGLVSPIEQMEAGGRQRSRAA